MAVCARAQTAIFYFGAKSWSIRLADSPGRSVVAIRLGQFALTNPCRRIRVARFTVVAFAAATFAVFCAIFRFSRPLPGLHDARL
jgi:hypothetical protein